ncbi:MAG: BPSS1780 family membrane protein [Burkholderiales bacterium]
MSARVVSFARGARWVAEGWRLFRVSPALWLALVFAYWMIMTTVSLVPVVGLAAATLLIPAFSVGFMAASRSCERRGKLEIILLFEGFRSGPGAQLVLGCIYLALLAMLVGATTIADGGSLARWMTTGRRPDEQALQSEDLFAALLVAGGLYLPIMMLFWFAPVLAAWHAMGPLQALFYSFFASLLNWRAFLGYGVFATLVTVVIPFLVLGALLLASGGRLKFNVMTVIFPLLIFLLPTLVASFYASYRDVFPADDGVGTPPPGPG